MGNARAPVQLIPLNPARPCCRASRSSSLPRRGLLPLRRFLRPHQRDRHTSANDVDPVFLEKGLLDGRFVVGMCGALGVGY